MGGVADGQPRLGSVWAGGRLQRCREELAAAVSDAEVCSALVPVSAERVLDLVLTSAVWLVILALISGGFLLQLERQNRTLELLLERLEATDINP